MPESIKTKILRYGFNLYPAYCGTGGRITYIASDWREVHVKLTLSWRTRNYVGTIYGGSMYGSVDPVYMLMLIKILGPEYIVWDKAASIRFKKPGNTALFAKFIIIDEELNVIKTALATLPSVERVYHVELVDAEGVVHATIDKTLYIKKRHR